MNRQTLKDIPGTTTLDAYSDYDLAGRPVYARFGSTAGSGIDYGYDTAKRLSSETQYGRAVTFQYDLAGNRTRLTYPDTNYIQYDYDALNRMTHVRENGAASGIGVLATYTYDALSRRDFLARGNGTSGDYGYDAASRLNLVTIDINGTAQDLSRSFTHNLASQIKTRANSNDLYEWVAGSANKTYVTDKLNRYSTVNGVAFNYDTNGNLTGDGGRAFAYDAENRLTSVGGSASMALDYDPLGRLRQTIAGSTTTQFLYDGVKLVAEYNGAGVLQRRYVHGPGTDDPIVWYEGSALTTRNFLHADERGSVLATSDNAGGGTAYQYGPYGEPTTWAGSRFRYTGQTALAEVQLYYYKARVYDPVLGRFLQTDPIGSKDDLNLYAYTYNDPANKTDPTGECPWCLVGAVAGAAVSAVVQYSTTGKVDVQQVGIAAAAGFISGGVSTIIAATAATGGAVVAANAVAGGAIGAAQTAASTYAATGSAPSVKQVAEGAVVGAVLGGAGARVGVVADKAAAAATNGIKLHVQQMTSSAMTAAERQAATIGGPISGNVANQVVQSSGEVASGIASGAGGTNGSDKKSALDPPPRPRT